MTSARKTPGDNILENLNNVCLKNLRSDFFSFWCIATLYRAFGAKIAATNARGERISADNAAGASNSETWYLKENKIEALTEQKKQTNACGDRIIASRAIPSATKLVNANGDNNFELFSAAFCSSLTPSFCCSNLFDSTPWLFFPLCIRSIICGCSSCNSASSLMALSSFAWRCFAVKAGSNRIAAYKFINSVVFF